MRIIAGKHRGRRLAAPPGEHTRPTLDKTRQAVFNILQGFVPGARVLDAFAGSGALGLEALSRGAEYAWFCDDDRAAADAVQANIEAMGLRGQASIYLGDVFCFLNGAQRCGEGFSLVFLDPPYGKGLVEKALAALLCPGILKEGAIIVCETAKGEAFSFPPVYRLRTSRNYGKNSIHILELTTEGEA